VNLAIFDHPQFGMIRISDLGGNPWFVAKDVCEALGYLNPRDAIITHCKGVVKCDTLVEGGYPQSIIPESDVYRLVMRSRLPMAEQFQDWVVEEVLPSIRRTGGYSHDVASLLPKDYISALRALIHSEERKIELEAELEVAKPKVEFYDTVSKSETVCEMAIACQVAKLPFGRNTLFAMLRRDGVLISRGPRYNLPKQAYILQGLFTVDESFHTDARTGKIFIHNTTHVTQKGIDWIIRRFRTGSVPETFALEISL